MVSFRRLVSAAKQRGTVDAHRRVDDVPAAGELTGEVRDGLAPADLFDHPLGRPGREHAAHGGDPVVAEGEGALAGSSVSGQTRRCFFQRKRDRHATEGQVDVGDDRAVLHPGPAATARTHTARATACSMVISPAGPRRA